MFHMVSLGPHGREKKIRTKGNWSREVCKKKSLFVITCNSYLLSVPNTTEPHGVITFQLKFYCVVFVVEFR